MGGVFHFTDKESEDREVKQFAQCPTVEWELGFEAESSNAKFHLMHNSKIGKFLLLSICLFKRDEQIVQR